MISPINFRGVKIGSEMKCSMPRIKGEEEPTGFYQVVNFLDRIDTLDFKIKKPSMNKAKIDTYDKTGKRIATTSVPVRQFATDPKGVIGEVGISLYSGKKAGKIIFSDMFEASNKSADSSITENAQTCSDYHDTMISNSKGIRFE